MSSRRVFITLLGGAAAWSLAARAQQPERMRRVGVLMPSAESDPEYQGSVASFRDALVKLGWVEGRNLRIDYRWAGGAGIFGLIIVGPAAMSASYRAMRQSLWP
jgi:putative ABC transport system substrate-binding protein